MGAFSLLESASTINIKNLNDQILNKKTNIFNKFKYCNPSLALQIKSAPQAQTDFYLSLFIEESIDLKNRSHFHWLKENIDELRNYYQNHGIHFKVKSIQKVAKNAILQKSRINDTNHWLKKIVSLLNLTTNKKSNLHIFILDPLFEPSNPLLRKDKNIQAFTLHNRILKQQKELASALKKRTKNHPINTNSSVFINFNENQSKFLLAHEIGHALGLQHVSVESKTGLNLMQLDTDFTCIPKLNIEQLNIIKKELQSPEALSF